MRDVKYPSNVGTEAGPNTDTKIREIIDAINQLSAFTDTLTATTTQLQALSSSVDKITAALAAHGIIV